MIPNTPPMSELRVATVSVLSAGTKYALTFNASGSNRDMWSGASEWNRRNTYDALRFRSALTGTREGDDRSILRSELAARRKRKTAASGKKRYP